MEEIVKFFGGTVIAISAVAWLIRSLIVHFLGKDVEAFKTQLKYEAEHGNHLLMQKIQLYKEVSNPVISLIVKAQHGDLTKQSLSEFDQERLKITALLAMFEPKEVFEEFNTMIDYVYDSFEEKQQWSFDEFRNKALKFLSMVRKDVGLFEDTISYSGTR